MKSVVKRTGLSAHVIRVWERRYRVVEPKRTSTNRRAYSAEDIERLQLLAQLTQAGQSIGFLAGLSTEQLQRLANETPPDRGTGDKTGVDPVDACVHAIERLDPAALEAQLADAETRFGVQGLLQRVVAPLAERIGERWRDGTLTAAHEHFASAVLRTVLGRAVRPFGGADNSPGIVVATPAGQLHELGALIAAALASNLGWRVIYLGASLPPAEIAAAARQHEARVIGLSLVYPADDSRLEDELTRLRDILPAETRIVVGGRAASAYASALTRIGATRVDAIDEFGRYLDALRQPPAKR